MDDQQQVNLQNITDIKELKALKADRYDILEVSQQRAEIARQEINAINQRLSQLLEGQPAPADTPVIETPAEPQLPTINPPTMDNALAEPQSDPISLS